MIPTGARVGTGAIVAALVASAAGLPAGALAGATAVTAGGAVAAGLLGGRSPWRGAAAVLAGAGLVLARLLLPGGAATPAGDLPAGGGPWTGRVVAVGTPAAGTQRLTLALDGPSGVLLAVSAPRYPAVEPGDLVRVDGTPAAPPDGGYGDFLRRTGVAGTLRTRTLERMGRAGDAASLLERTRRAAGDALTIALPEPAAGLATGILIGLRDRVDRDLAAAFTTTGLSHVVAISGWNIALVAGLVGALLAGRARRTRSGAIVIAIGAYTVLAGASASVVRAAAMAGVALLARETGRPGTAAAALGWAIACLVVAVPSTASDVGLQLSAAATAGLIAWSGPLTALLARRAGHLPAWVREGLGVSLAAQAATLPIVLLSFGRLAPLSPLLNLAVVPLVPLAMAAGALALAGGAVAALGGPLLVASLAGLPGAIVLGILVALVRTAATLPFANVALDPPAGAVAAGVVVLASLVVRLRRRAAAAITALASPRLPEPAPGRQRGRPTDRRSRRLLRVAAILAGLAVAIVVLAAATRPDGRVHVTVLDVGQGDAILVTGPSGGRMLVDGGPDPDRLLVALDGRLPPWDRRIDLVVLTHPHEDHVAGLPLLLDRYRVGRVAEPGMPGLGPGYRAFVAALAAHGMVAAHLGAGGSFALDGVAFDVLWPTPASVPAEPSDDGNVVNDCSIVLLGAFEGRRFLLTGDAEADVEHELVARGLPRVDLLKAGHHGSRTSTTDELVAALRPRVAAISVGADNDYGHPAAEVLARLEAAGAMVLRTDLVGTIDVALDADGLEVRTERPVRAPAGAAAAGARATRSGAVTAGSGARSAAPPPSGARGAVPYHRWDVRPLAPGRRRPPALPRPARLAPAPLARRRGGRGVPGGPGRGARRARRPAPRGGGRPPPRRGQVASGERPGRDPPPRAGLRRLAGRPGARGARACRVGAHGDAPHRRRRRRLARNGDARGAPRRLRRQAGRAASRVDGLPLRRLAPPLSGRLERRGRRGRLGPGGSPGGRGLPPCRPRGRGCPAPGLDGGRPPRSPPRRR